ncbi:Phosphoribosyltransferase domain-containing protein [Aromatoleum bremense]|uniref:ComF family protein n=1 Tax=Aromatoleum bremense TaxID=76115 RepID=A0ABX1NRZ4_9RHOO|nr:ComF family protein [Aromatoleum bremense]NMG14759.1 ComF family protein [Aromatoleum bremense]QTQ30968.1 Phosphoribosyltransferase domain-containing protein [Aromatoleum bremense]
MSNVLNALRFRTRRIADLLMPQDCFVCGSMSGAAALCSACRNDLPRQPASCPVCAVPTANGATCGRCLRNPPAFDASRAAFAYTFPVDRIVQGLKYRHRLALANFFAEALLPFGPPRPASVLLPMPLHVRRLRQRGFNQAVEIARPLGRAWGLPLELAGVGRTLNTAPQVSLPWKERSVNMRGAFHCEASFAGRTVIVVDDVMTTGATLDELARTLKMHGAARVENLVVARTPSPH